ncbi:hypothetical protein ACLOJK_026326 [Asimina triloba]
MHRSPVLLSIFIKAMKILSSQPAFLLPVAFFTIQIFGARMINGDEGLIMKSCNLTAMPDYCIAVLESDERSFSAEDLKGLVKISIDHCYTNAVDTYKFINEKLLTDASATDDPTLRQCLEKCSYVYDLGAHRLLRVLDLLDKEDYYGADEKIGDATDVSAACGVFFIQKDVPIPPTLAFKNAILFNLTSFSLDLALHLG